MLGKHSRSTPKHIKSSYKREVTFVKRKRGLIKKAMELSILCNKEVLVYIYDQKKNGIVSYEANPSTFSISDLQKKLADFSAEVAHLESYDNTDFDLLKENSYIGKNLINQNQQAKRKSKRKNSENETFQPQKKTFKGID